MPGSKEPCSVGEALCIRETDKAILVELSDGEEKWIPRSCVHDDSEVYGEGHKGDLVLFQWFAEKENMI